MSDHNETRDDGLTWLGRKWLGWRWRRMEGNAARDYHARMGHNDPLEIRAERIRIAAPRGGLIFRHCGKCGSILGCDCVGGGRRVAQK